MRPATLDDIPAVVAVGRACDLQDIGEVDVQENWVRDEWVRPRFDPLTDAWVVTEPSGEVVAATYTWDQEPHTLFDSAGWVHPAHRGQGIGTALVLAVEGRAVRDLAEVPAGSAPRVLQSFDADASGAHDPDASGARVLLEELGYSPEREYLHMEIDVPDGFVAADAPAGIVVRPRSEADDRDIVAAMADAFDDPWDYEEARQEFAVSTTYDPSLWFIALDGDEAVGALFGYMTTDNAPHAIHRGSTNVQHALVRVQADLDRDGAPDPEDALEGFDHPEVARGMSDVPAVVVQDDPIALVVEVPRR